MRLGGNLGTCRAINEPMTRPRIRVLRTVVTEASVTLSNLEAVDQINHSASLPRAYGLLGLPIPGSIGVPFN